MAGTIQNLLLLSLFASSSIGAALPTSSASDEQGSPVEAKPLNLIPQNQNRKLGSIPKARLGYTSNQKPMMPAVVPADQLKKFVFHVPYYAG
ncbi:hypothetical protein BT69DRAFT_1344079, partial [Atractiella rhizophila]